MDGDDDKPAGPGKSKTETVKLKATHTHNRQPCKAGDRITVPVETARKLRAQDVCE